MKARTIASVAALVVVAAACSSAPPVATVGDTEFKDDDVRSLRSEEAPADANRYLRDLEALILAESYSQVAADRFDVTVTDAEIDEYIQKPPPHLVEQFARFDLTAELTDAAVRIQVARWVLADEVSVILVRGDPASLSFYAGRASVSPEDVTGDPISFMMLQEVQSTFNTWTTALAAGGELPVVTVDPSIGSWSAEFRLLSPPGG